MDKKSIFWRYEHTLAEADLIIEADLFCSEWC